MRRGDLDDSGPDGDHEAMPPFSHFAKSLCEPFPAPVWPVGTRVTSFLEEERPEAAHQLLDGACRESGGGQVCGFAAWWEGVRTDIQYDPAVFFFVVDDTDRVAAVALCWCDGFVKDLAVAAPWRRRGLGTALLLHVFEVFAARGACSVALKVENDNPSGAARLYHRLGLRAVVPDEAEA